MNRVPVPRADDLDCPSYDWFAGMCFPRYVLCQWMRDTRGKRTARPPIDGPSDGAQTNKRPYVMGSRKNAERHDSSDVSSCRATRMTGLSRRRGLGWNKSERIADQKIATSLSLRKRR